MTTTTTTPLTEPALRLAHRVECTAAEGPGRRAALWLAGCTLRCPGCCNPELFDPAAGVLTPVADLLADLLAARARHRLDGVTLLGGEPLDQLGPLADLVTGLSGHGLGVILFTGRTLAEARALPGWPRLAAGLDAVVDGRFDPARREPHPGGRRWIGSTNQRVHHLTPRYADPALWRGPDHLEIHVTPAGDLALHGHPDLARRLRRHLPVANSPAPCDTTVAPPELQNPKR